MKSANWKGSGGRFGFATRAQGRVDIGKVAYQNAIRPTVASDVMDSEGKEMAFAGDMNQMHGQNSAGGQVDANLPVLPDERFSLIDGFGGRQGTKIGDGECEARLFGDDLGQLPIHHAEVGAQCLVAQDQLANALLDERIVYRPLRGERQSPCWRRWRRDRVDRESSSGSAPGLPERHKLCPCSASAMLVSTIVVRTWAPIDISVGRYLYLSKTSH